MSDRDFTLLPPVTVDKRTKEVFTLSLERISARTRQGFAHAMDGLDSGPSVQRMFGAPFRLLRAP
ncbi:protein of unknown function [Pseudomonas mediterranea]